ncbi:MAG: hypothetical protein QM643_12320, partial [Shinella sp.]
MTEYLDSLRGTQWPGRCLFVWLLGAAGFLLSAMPAQADILWLQRSGDKVQAWVGELQKPVTSLPELADPQPVQREGLPALAYEQAADHFSFAPGGGDARFRAAHAGTDGVLTHYQARYGRAETKAINDLELVPTEPGGSTFRLFFKGRPANASRVNVETAAGWRKSLTPNPDGTVTLDTPIPGLYVLEVTAKVNNASVTVEGRKYEDVR